MAQLPGQNQVFEIPDDANFDPVNFFDARMKEIKQSGRRKAEQTGAGH